MRRKKTVAERLDRCPGCGEFPTLDLDGAWQLYYTCVKCAVSADGGDTVDEARKKWNKLMRRRKNGSDAGDQR